MPPGFGRAVFFVRQEFPPDGRPIRCVPGVHRVSSGLVPTGAAAMPKFIIERQVPGASRFTHDELHSISRRSVGVLRQLGPEIQWVESYVAGDNLYCVYVAPDEEMVREHGRLGGFPVNKVTEIKTTIDPTTAE